MKLLETLVSLWFFLLCLSLLYWPSASTHHFLQTALLEEDANNIFYALGGFDNASSAQSALQAAGVCITLDGTFVEEAHLC